MPLASALPRPLSACGPRALAIASNSRSRSPHLRCLLRCWEPRDCEYPIPSWRETLESTPQAKAWKALHASQNKKAKHKKAMKTLLLITLAISGLALVPAQLSNAETPTVLVPRTGGLSFGFPSGYDGYPRYLNYYPYGYYRHPYVHYYPYAGNPYSYYSAPPSYRYSGHRTYRHHRHHYHKTY